MFKDYKIHFFRSSVSKTWEQVVSAGYFMKANEIGHIKFSNGSESTENILIYNFITIFNLFNK